ncbi:MvaI/BcnI family restriction endonuclease [uncultured Ruegeria sp.]|uniref:MvaI/BcnI family restriction endonuclease n=1 Tax=uncultured Ruegeria sp. TaxID=259304 RepID=UPI00261FE3E7|nr:MvaI/BcnI family restriction endonuclease [uncultured Ruegeria sp.]
MLSVEAKKLIEELAQVSLKGPIKAVGHGATSVGMTLLKEMGIDYQSTRKPTKYGIVVSARRGSRSFDPHRVNLFAAVPDWDISPLKSSAQILNKYGYLRSGEKKLYCSVRAGQPNPQGLVLRHNRVEDSLEEWAVVEGREEHVASWRMERLKARLSASHPETIWVSASSSTLGGVEYFHYRHASHSSAARVELLPELICEGTITLDHLISKKNGRVTEKGPLFKIRPRNIPLLFPGNSFFDLLSM